jgi:hypothetical protein
VIPPAAEADPIPVRFAGTVQLTKPEVFVACQALADADRFLLRAGAKESARALGDLFDLLEERLTAPGPVVETGSGTRRPDQDLSGSNSSDNEFTQ